MNDFNSEQNKPFTFNSGKALWKHREKLQEQHGRLVNLSKIINRISDSGIAQYGQLFSTVLEFNPSLIIEVGRAYGNSTAILVEAANQLPNTRKVVSVCMTDIWQRDISKKIAKTVPKNWFDKLEVYQKDFIDIPFNQIIDKNDSILFIWDAHGFDLAEYILSDFLPFISRNKHLVLIHDVLDLRYHTYYKDYKSFGVWKGYWGDHANGSFLIIDGKVSAFEEIIPLHDFAQRNNIKIHSVENEIRETVYRKKSKQEELEKLIGKEMSSPTSSFHWFSLAEGAHQTFTFPRSPFDPKNKTEVPIKPFLPKKPLVSIITPCFNSGAYLEACIKSVFAQDYPNVEHIIQDANSTDRTKYILKKYSESKYKRRIRIVSETDNGQSDGLDKALKRSKGDILLVLNADDELLPYACSWGIAQLQKYPECAVVYGDEYIINEEGETIDFFVGKYPYRYDKIICVEFVRPAQAAFIRRNMMEQVGLYADTTLLTCPDFEMWVRLGARFPMRHEFGPVCKYRHHKQSEGRLPEMIGEMVVAKKSVIDRVLSDPKTPLSITKLKKRAYAGLYHWAAISASSIGAYRIAIRYLFKSFLYRPQIHKIIRLYRLITKHSFRYLLQKSKSLIQYL